MTDIAGLSRRSFLYRSAAVIAATGMTPIVLSEAAGAAPTGAGYGPLVSDPNGLLDLPAGFTYRTYSRSGADLLTSGEPVPGNHDGMGAFAVGNGITLIRNHELSAGATPPVPRDSGITYNPAAAGGCTQLRLNAAGDLIESKAVLAGTIRNCAGGITPWRSWISCEETEQTLDGMLHGYNFEVPVNGIGGRQPIKAMGRFAHEAIAVDPATGVVYETEDASGPYGLFYRYLPNSTPGANKGAVDSLQAGGTLQAMKIPGITNSNQIDQIGIPFPNVQWVTVPTPDVPAGSTVRGQVIDQVTQIQKCEGAWYGNGAIYFTSSFSTAGIIHQGQVFRYDPVANSITLVAIFTESDPFDGPDNLVVSPGGDVFVCEDGDDEQHVVGINPDGSAFLFAKNAVNDNEFAGACFHPDGQTMYVNTQSPGVTFAITGPFDGAPAPVVPESPLTVGLPLAGAAAGAGLWALHNRRNKIGGDDSSTTDGIVSA